MQAIGNFRRDFQDAPPVRICDECGGEIYSELAYAVIRQRCVCLACEARLLERLIRNQEGRAKP